MSASAQIYTPLSIYIMLRCFSYGVCIWCVCACVCVLVESMECVVSAGFSGLGLTMVALS